MADLTDIRETVRERYAAAARAAADRTATSSCCGPIALSDADEQGVFGGVLYDGAETDDPADLQIDHLVPLADAWRSGADSWTPERRRAFANDRTSPDTLIAVSGRTNQSKGDSTPDEWLPPDAGSWCAYAEMWVHVKATWDLSVTAPERDRLAELLAAC